jgi:hypothetical protein
MLTSELIPHVATISVQRLAEFSEERRVQAQSLNGMSQGKRRVGLCFNSEKRVQPLLL